MKPLSPFEKWMVQSNLKTIQDSGVSTEHQASVLIRNGYPRVASAVIGAGGRRNALIEAKQAENQP